jgi:glucose/arabinose dehydrogenase
MFYVYATLNNADPNSPFSTHIREYQVSSDPNVAIATPVREMLSFPRPASNHVGGWIGFNPKTPQNENQYLYIMSGDGGGAGDDDAGHTPGTGNGQDITDNFFGKTLRIDVNGADAYPADATRNYAIPAGNPLVGATGDDEIWAYGLRNPYRAGFDRLTGDLWIGDVGQSAREEIDFQSASKTTVSNYGWRLWEGNLDYYANPGDPFPPNYVGPVYDYGRGSGDYLGETVIGGYPYRGPDPDLQGQYFFADASDDNTWQMNGPGGTVTNIDGLLGNLTGIERIVSYAEDYNGNLYLIDMATGTNNSPNANSGEVYRILTNNSFQAGDYDRDGEVDLDDYLKWKADYGTTTPFADGNHDGRVNAADYTVWRNNLGAGGAGAVVPEPAAIALFVQLAAALAALPFRRRRRIACRRTV